MGCQSAWMHRQLRKNLRPNTAVLRPTSFIKVLSSVPNAKVRDLWVGFRDKNFQNLRNVRHWKRVGNRSRHKLKTLMRNMRCQSHLNSEALQNGYDGSRQLAICLLMEISRAPCAIRHSQGGMYLGNADNSSRPSEEKIRIAASTRALHQ